MLEPASIWTSLSSLRINAKCAPSVCRRSGPGKNWENLRKSEKPWEHEILSRSLSHLAPSMANHGLRGDFVMWAAQRLTKSFLEHSEDLIHTPTSLLYVANNRCIEIRNAYGVLVKQNGFRLCYAATVILGSLAIWSSTKSRSWMVLFGLLLAQFVSSFDRANGLSMLQFDAVRFIDFSANFFDRWVQWIRDSCYVFDFWKSKIKIYLEVDAIIVSILNFETRCSISASSPV